MAAEDRVRDSEFGEGEPDHVLDRVAGHCRSVAIRKPHTQPGASLVCLDPCSLIEISFDFRPKSPVVRSAPEQRPFKIIETPFRHVENDRDLRGRPVFRRRIVPNAVVGGIFQLIRNCYRKRPNALTKPATQWNCLRLLREIKCV